MPSRSLAAIAAAMAGVCSAYAETRVDARHSYGTRELELGPTLRIHPAEHVTIDRASVVLRVVPGSIMATLTLGLSSIDRGPQNVTLPIDAPPGTLVTGLSITMGKMATSVAKPLAAFTAREHFQDIVRQARDPVLLELADQTARRARFELHVFPISKQDSSTVEIEMQLPPGTSLDLDPSTQAIARVDVDVSGEGIEPRALHLTGVDRPQTIELGEASLRRDWMSEDPVARTHVDATTSLFSGVWPETLAVLPRMTLSSCGGMGDTSINKTEIRRFVKLQRPRLQHCYMLAAQRDPTLAGEVALHFTIEKDGSVTAEPPTSAIKDPSFVECISAEPTTWRFRPSDTTVVVSYPLTFVLSR
jgi:hypothetical protein